MENRIVISRSEKFRKIDRRFLWHPYSSHSAIRKNDFPVIVRGQGPYLFDCEEKRYFDAISSWWCCNLGHNHPRIVAAIKHQSGKLQHSILGNMSHPPAIELAERLAGLFPDKNRRVFFSSDGSSSVEAALKIAVQYWHNIGKPERRKIISLENAYHGDTLGSVSVGFLPQFHRPFKPLTFPVLRAMAPFCTECGCSLTPSSTYNNFPPEADPPALDRKAGLHSLCGRGGTRLSRPTIKTSCQSPNSCTCDCFKSMEKIIEKHAGEIAGVIVEPLCQCAAGMRIYPPSYLKKLSQLCRKHDILLIADEIAVGFGRTGKMFAFEHAGIDPDIVCLGKGLTGGYLPLSAAIVKESIYATFSDSPQDHTFYHGHTFAGNPIAAAAANGVLKIFREDEIVRGARRKGEMMKDKMTPLRSMKGVKNVRCLGMIAAIEFTPEGGSSSRIQAIQQSLLKHGVLIRPLGNVIYLMPPLITPDKLIGRTIDLLGKTLEEVN